MDGGGGGGSLPVKQVSTYIHHLHMVTPVMAGRGKPFVCPVKRKFLENLHIVLFCLIKKDVHF